MTLQVGMIGIGGIILAGDLKESNDIAIRGEREGNVADAGRLKNKIEFDHERKIAVSCAIDLNFARTIARRIIDELEPRDLTDEGTAYSAIERIVGDGLATEKKKAEWLIALKCPDWKLFKCSVAPVDPEQRDTEWSISCEPCFTLEFAGHTTNPVIYLRKYYDDLLPIEQLVPLAAHMILSAPLFNSYGIEGLEIIQCDESGVRKLSEGSIKNLKAATRQLDNSLGEALTQSGKEYTYSTMRRSMS